MTPSTPKGIGDFSMVMHSIIVCSLGPPKVMTSESIKRKSPGIVMVPSYPSPMAGEDKN